MCICTLVTRWEIKCNISNPCFGGLSHQHVKISPTKCTVLKVDLLQAPNIFALRVCTCVFLTQFTGGGGEGVNKNCLHQRLTHRE